MKSLLLVSLSALLFVGCSDNRDTGIEYASQMYHSIPVNGYSQMDYNEVNLKLFGDGRNVIMPVPGTVARGKADYYYPYTKDEEGYEQAGKELKNPLEPTEEVLASGKRLYSLHCQHCHGTNGDGQGPLNKSAQYADRVPDYRQRIPTISEGKAFHSVTYGRNIMGAHAYILSPTERWQVISYIYTFVGGGKAEGDAKATDAKTDATAEAKK